MKILFIKWCILFIFFNYSFGQTGVVTRLPGPPTLEEKVTKSNLVIEGQVIAVKCFHHKDNIYTSAVIKISKIFKGYINDSVVELVFLGGVTDSDALIISGGLILNTGMAGIFFVENNRPEISLVKSIASYWPTFGSRSYIGYHEESYMVAHHIATCVGIAYDDLEKDLFQPIEAITKIPRKVLGPNMFEQKPQTIKSK
ncbi:MAG: hypothetical protein JWO06_1386 [Bacteroidota bacterium]|nr:hypothetical protein [Bacteroidota bacterium]